MWMEGGVVGGEDGEKKEMRADTDKTAKRSVRGWNLKLRYGCRRTRGRKGGREGGVHRGRHSISDSSLPVLPPRCQSCFAACGRSRRLQQRGCWRGCAFARARMWGGGEERGVCGPMLPRVAHARHFFQPG